MHTCQFIFIVFLRENIDSFFFSSQAYQMDFHILGTQEAFVVLKWIALNSLPRKETPLLKIKPLI